MWVSRLHFLSLYFGKYMGTLVPSTVAAVIRVYSLRESLNSGRLQRDAVVGFEKFVGTWTTSVPAKNNAVAQKIPLDDKGLPGAGGGL